MIRFCLVLPLVFVSSSDRAVDPPFANSIVSTDFDFILDSDPSALESYRYVERGRREMPDKRSGELFADAYVFEAVYAGGDVGEKRVEIWANCEFGSIREASPYAWRLAEAIGRQPALFREALGHVVLHEGDETAFAEERGGFFVIYSENMDKRVSTSDLEETVFHESAHVALSPTNAIIILRVEAGREISQDAVNEIHRAVVALTGLPEDRILLKRNRP